MIRREFKDINATLAKEDSARKEFLLDIGFLKRLSLMLYFFALSHSRLEM